MHDKVFQIVGYKNTGKTTLICRLIEMLAGKGIRVGVVKHDAHDFDMDHLGTDTWKHRKAGAKTVAITSEHRTAIIREKSTPLYELISQFNDVDVILVEGYKFENFPKILIIRTEKDIELMDQIQNVKAVASWLPQDRLNFDSDQELPFLTVDDVFDICEVIKTFILR
jgi:molybdopterin-guanine dinucleotide biosynthesis protein B